MAKEILLLTSFHLLSVFVNIHEDIDTIDSDACTEDVRHHTIGIQCGDFVCSSDSNAFCNSTTSLCQCKTGYFGNPKIMCTETTNHICHLYGDPHVTTFNRERSAILVPCKNILTHLDITKTGIENLFLKVTAVVRSTPFARFASQMVTTGLFVEMMIRNEPKGLIMFCNDNGCYDTVENIQYHNFTGSPTSSLEFTVTTNANNQQVISVPLYELEIRFRGEDNSVAIKIPSSSVVDLDTGLCNNFVNPTDFNAKAQQLLAYTSLDNYLLSINEINVPLSAEQNDPLCHRLRMGCDPKERESIAINACSLIYTDRPFSTCFYSYRGGNDSLILQDYIDCRKDVCDNTDPQALCAMIGLSGCQMTTNVLTCP
ncbi:hypothetical protein LOTGIDRAFT_237895 [Lottia gigantea]|uniref:Uncharacterized protein n=1 Tax=Lottia gigantea TaxID=225164 RepID=V4AF75_LOTGI|nr:hypothetical protein LOTGIDRAFT_237895 [Lottia gigantea]ESP02674.1 hypothetical protein LOTGIDRAFT_237895 [Lottia gigantea]